MKICITLDDVLRAKTKQFGKYYKKVKDPDIDLDELELTTDDLCELFKFENEKEYAKFLYNDFPFEIFGEAPVMESMLDKRLNLWLMKVTEDDEYDENIDVIIANPFEYNTSIGNTCFFLSKIATRVRKFIFPSYSSEIWDSCDVLITASTKLLNNKPQGKIAVKIEMPYNKDCESDYTYEKLDGFLSDDKIIEELIEKTKNDI